MSIISKLAIEYMKKNKKRTIVTIIGVMISVALITGTITLCTTYIDYSQRTIINLTGEWHSAVLSVPSAKNNWARNSKMSKNHLSKIFIY